MIVTGPINRMGDTFASALERGDRGVLVTGNGRDGKTWGVECLILNPQWQPFPVAFFVMDYGKPEKSTENYFSGSILAAGDMKVVRHASGVESMSRACNLLLEQTKSLREEIIGVVINEANRFTAVEREHLVTLDNMIEHRKKRVFYILIYQNDAEFTGSESIDDRPPPQITGRFYSMAHQFTGLLWSENSASIDFQNCDVSMALNEYDEGIIFPDDENGVPCTAYFARNAYASNYRLTSQAGLFREVVEDVRLKNRLPVAAPFPMQSFERFVYFLLVRIAGEDPNFRQFTRDQVLQALLWSGYVELELSKHPVMSNVFNTQSK